MSEAVVPIESQSSAHRSGAGHGGAKWHAAVRNAGTSRHFQPGCANCQVRAMCLPSSLDASEMRLLNFMVATRRRVHRGQALYRAGDPLSSIYPIRAGFFKTVMISRSGDEHVTGLHMGGDVLGLDGVRDLQHRCYAIALDHAEVCVVPYANVLQQSLHEEPLQRLFYDLLGREIAREQDLVLLLGGMWGLQRVAAFLLDFSRRMQARGYSPLEFELRLTRRDMGSYLGMQLETVSRIVSRLEREGLVVAERGHITIRDRDALARVAGARPERMRGAAPNAPRIPPGATNPDLANDRRLVVPG